MRREQSPAACLTECQYRDSWSLSCCHQLQLYADHGTSIALSEIHSHWLYNCSQILNTSHVKYPKESAGISQCQHANKITHQRGSGKSSTRRDSTWTEQIERSQRQHGSKQVSGVAKAPQDDQHDVYTTGAGPVVGSGSTALSK